VANLRLAFTLDLPVGGPSSESAVDLPVGQSSAANAAAVAATNNAAAIKTASPLATGRQPLRVMSFRGDAPSFTVKFHPQPARP
jgi:hypothetical protein